LHGAIASGSESGLDEDTVAAGDDSKLNRSQDFKNLLKIITTLELQ
jgi:hypothetical protein